jgi:uncharacterized protein YbaA (DUF1428 family)
MTYVQGFMIPVTEANKAAYKKMAEETAPIFIDHGALRIVENWDNQVPKGATTDMYLAVRAEKDERVVFSWIEWESENACNDAHEKIMADERMQNPPEEMPFDGMRMVYAGFNVLGESGDGGSLGYVQGYVAPVAKEQRQPFSNMCATMREIAIDSGALHAVDSLSYDIEDGKVTDFKRAVDAEADEGVAFGFVEWASKEAHETGSAKMREDKRMTSLGGDLPVDGKRMIFGGFEVMLDTGHH